MVRPTEIMAEQAAGNDHVNRSPSTDAIDTEDAPRRGSHIADVLFPKEFHAQPAAAKRSSIDKTADPSSSPDRSSDENALPAYDGEEFERTRGEIASTAEDLVTRVINVEDDPTLNPWTFRTFFLGTLI